jgi:hypothetical protein
MYPQEEVINSSSKLEIFCHIIDIIFNPQREGLDGLRNQTQLFQSIGGSSAASTVHEAL